MPWDWAYKPNGTNSLRDSCETRCSDDFRRRVLQSGRTTWLENRFMTESEPPGNGAHAYGMLSGDLLPSSLKGYDSTDYVSPQRTWSREAQGVVAYQDPAALR